MSLFTLLVTWAFAALGGCRNDTPPTSPGAAGPITPAPATEAAIRGGDALPGAEAAQARHDEREEMVRAQIEARGVRDQRVLAAMRAVPRHAFVPEAFAHEAYGDFPLPIGHEATISQPYIVALMTELADVQRGERVLEVGTGSGYQAAVLAALGAQVYSIEIVAPLADKARTRLRRLGYGNVEVRHGDGYAGWPEHAPFDAIVVTAAAPQIPRPLEAQLAIGGRLVIPVGESFQDLVVRTRTADGFDTRADIPVRFVPMTGKVQEGR